MYRIKWTALLFALCFLLCSCGEQAEKSEVMLYKGDDASKQEEKFKTTKVKKGVYEEKISAVGKLYYTDENVVTIDEEDVYLDKICVKGGQKVKKGDVIAIYHIETSKASLRKKKLLMEQARTEYDSNVKSKQSEVLAKEKSIQSLTKESEKRIARIELKQMKSEYRQLLKSGADIRKQEKDYAELVRKQKKTNLKSKYSGTVVSPKGAAEFEGESASGEELMKIRNEDKFLVSVEDEKGGLRYNMTVDIGLGTSSEEIQHRIKGKVISTSNLLDSGGGEEESDDSGSEGESGGGTRLIKISKSDMRKYNFKKYNLFVTGVTLQIENSLIVDAEAVNEETEKDDVKRYVLLVENGKLHKRYITSNYQQEKYYLVNQGVEEGQTLAIIK